MNMNRAGLFRKVAWLVLLLMMLAAEAVAATAVLEADKDNTLYEDVSGGVSNGAGEQFFAGKTADNLTRRALLAFDVAGRIPAGSTVNSVSLRLTMTRSSSPATALVALHAVTRDWGEGSSNAGANEGSGAPVGSGDATWLHTFYPASLWTAAGGDYRPAASAAFPVGGLATYTWSSPELAADVQQWLDNPASNFGWIVIGNESVASTAKRFASRENAFAGVRPALTVDYTPPAAGGTLQLTVGANQGVFTSGQILQLSIGVSNPGQAAAVDVYVVILLPGGSALVNFTGVDGTFEFGSLAALGALTPLATALPLADPFDLSLAPFFVYPWSGGEPAGSYTAFFVLARTGAFADNAIDAGDVVGVASAGFTFTP